METKTISIFSNKGGVGKTFIATNVATVLANSGKKVLLLELNLQSGHDIDKMMKLPMRHSLISLLSQIEKTESPKIINKATVSHSSGVDYLPAVLNPKQIAHIKPSSLKPFFEKACMLYEYIIVDAGKIFSEALLSVFEYSNLILLIATPDDLSIYKLKRCKEMLEKRHFPKEMVKLILNRSGSHGGMDWEEVQKALGFDIFAQIPSDGKTVGLALNKSVPCVLDSPRTEVANALKTIAQQLENEEHYIDRVEIEHGKEGEQLDKSNDLWKKLGISAEQVAGIIEMDEEDEEIALKKKIHEKLIRQMNIEDMSPEALSDAKKTKALRESASVIVEKLLTKEKKILLNDDEERERLTREIVSEAFGLGALEESLEDPDISDIMVNSRVQIFVERKGKLELAKGKFVSEDQMRSIIDRIIAPLGRRIDESVPMVDARLTDGSRFNAIIPPLSLTGPMITIRKFGRERPTVVDMLEKFNSLSYDMRDFIQACVLGRKNIIVSGGTGSGKTTLLNVVSSFIPEGERIVTIEDAAELRLNQRHWVRLESRPANIEGKGRVTIRTLFMNSLHMRPDRIIVGECRGSEVLDMLQAMNTGHDGSMTTLHANSTKDVLVRMSSMILLAGVELPMRAINEMISTALDVIVHVNRFADGSRKITGVTEVVGLTPDHQLHLQDVFVFDQQGTDADGTILGEYIPTGYIPKCYEEFEIVGIPLDKSIFERSSKTTNPDESSK